MGFLSSAPKFSLLSILILICSAQIKGAGEGNVHGGLLFVDSGHHNRFFRSESVASSTSQEAYMTISDVAAAISVLLGFAPSASHPSMSSKIDMLLTPNPFERPHVVFMLEAKGINQEILSALDFSKLGLESYSYRQLVAEFSHTAFELPGDEVILDSLNEASDDDCDAHCIEKELVDLALWLGGSYTGGRQPLQGNLHIPLAKESILTLNILKGADQIFAKELVSLLRNIRRVAAMHGDLAESSQDRAELLMGTFVGVEALQEHYGQDRLPRQAIELFLNVVAKLSHTLQLSYGGKIVGVVAINSNAVPTFEGMFDVKLSLRNSRWLGELGPSKSPAISNSTVSEVKLVRKAVAWSTAVILLISTLVGVHYLFNIPLTRDTLLYSSVKLD